MTDLPPYDSSWDLGGLPGGDVLFTEPTASVAGEPEPTAAVPPAGGTAYPPDPPVSATPQGTAPPRRPAYPRRRRVAIGAWPLVALLFWVVPAGVNAIRGHSDFGSSPSDSSSGPPPSQPAYDWPGMTILKPHSLTADSQLVTVHVNAPSAGTYTITVDGAPEATDVTAASDVGVDIPTELTKTLIVSTDSTAEIRCEIRDGKGEVLAVGQGLGILDCVYDPTDLLE